ncbi:hypothetical protein C2E25_00055 [Geothermobacter hydrogeniphilus]|uniref:Zinc-ribbon domain-containing protein n=1 Tax=Geothermobacter hydrogeniphilus TaxID=1969733 RepID=A0A2K2HEF4_9BACT|nr:hypothetical protein C2E25_00055 [Geothermobacter hydrogeniphilus]
MNNASINCCPGCGEARQDPRVFCPRCRSLLGIGEEGDGEKQVPPGTNRPRGHLLLAGLLTGILVLAGWDGGSPPTGPTDCRQAACPPTSENCISC